MNEISAERRQTRLLAMAVGSLTGMLVVKGVMPEQDAETLFATLDTGTFAATEIIDLLRAGCDAVISKHRAPETPSSAPPPG